MEGLPSPTSELGNGLGPISQAAAQFRDQLQRTRQFGHGISAAAFLAQNPHLVADPEAAVRIIYEEICYHQEKGHDFDLDAFLDQFPDQRAQLQILLDCHRLLDPLLPPQFPEVGETLGEFRLLAILGQGAFGRVFLASQPALADRPVVLKLAPQAGQEHLSLARLQHAHIVPLYLAQDFPKAHLHALCMPWLGGLGLNVLLHEILDVPPGQRTGRLLVEVLDRVSAAAPVPVPSVGPARALLSRLSFAQAVCWLVACLADALQYAHERRLVHLDLKPGNILLAADGQPMLLDFHLAQAPLQPGGPPPPWLGGTEPYMAPEQLTALRDLGHGRPLATPVDERSDIYGLGVVLYESLGGPVPWPADQPPPHLARINPQVSVGLGDVVKRCLSIDPARRYTSAAALAEELRRHLADLPLRGVANRSVRERWAKWRRRRPQLATIGSALLVAVLALGSVATGTGAYFWHQDELARTDLAEGESLFARGDYPAAERAFLRGREQLRPLAGWSSLEGIFDDRLQATHRALAARDLHLFVERVRFLVGVDALGMSERQAIESRCRAVWADRAALAHVPETHADLVDLVLVWADLRLGLAAVDALPTTRRDLLGLIGEAETLLGPTPVLRRLRHAQETALGITPTKPAEELAPRSAWEWAALGRQSLRDGDLARAADELHHALAQHPEDFWLHYYQGLCAYRQAAPEVALRHFHVCVALTPAAAECWYNRGLAFEGVGDWSAAAEDYDQALRLAPNFSSATFRRGTVRYRLGQYTEALVDLNRAIEDRVSPIPAHYYRGLAHLAVRNVPEGLRDLGTAWALRFPTPEKTPAHP